MKRKIEQKLEEWKKSRNRLPLIVQGARQVGKTYSLLSFGRKSFDGLMYFNFESDKELHQVFERDLSPGRIIRELSVLSGTVATEDRTLIFLDEIQSCPKALTSLKYFAEEAPGYAVVAAGSLLGIAINREGSSYPVGKVATMDMYPLDFEEYLWAVGQNKAVEIIRESFDEFTPCSLHETFLDHYRTYLSIGGMPRVVKEYLETGDLILSDMVKRNINDAYVADMARYADKADTVRIMAVYNSLPAQLAKDNHKFQYKVIRSGARVAEYGVAVDWLKAAGVVLACHKISEGRLPLPAFADPGAFKLYHADTGLLCIMAGLAGNMPVMASDIAGGFRGALAENYVATALVAAGFTPWYWESEGRAEVDFIIQLGNDVIPVEVKAAVNVRSRSLNEYVKRFSPPYSYRVSEKNFGDENNIRSVPFYAVFCINSET